ncbi:MAG: class I SAM-dependent methyltransferase [Candidatus Hermodarchaeota archaeon]|nr:class I SAM-dependent methyltransferase [Candidatus Hermodarchaeota archaeon]
MRKASCLTSRLMTSSFAKVMKHRIVQSSYYLIFGWTCGDTPRYLHQRPIVFDFLGEMDSLCILDVGCGAGMCTLEIVRKGSNAVALDVRIDFIKFLKESEPKLHVVLADAHYLPFKNGAFDKILCSEVLEHLEDDAKAIDEIARCSKRGGSTIFSTPCDAPCKWFEDKVLSAENFRIPFGHKRHGYSLDKLVFMLKEKGLIVQNHRMNMYFFTQLALYFSSLTRNRLPALLVTVIALFDGVVKFGEPYDIVIKARKA